MKLHLPIALRRALMAVFAVLRPAGIAALAATTAMAAETLTGKDVVISESASYPNGLIMQGTNSNKIETTLFGRSDVLVDVKGDASMTTGGLNAVVGNAYELNDIMQSAMEAYVKNYADKEYGEDPDDWKIELAKNVFIGAANTAIGVLIPKDYAAPTLTATGTVTMEGPANVIMLGSTVTGNTVSLKNNGTQLTSLGAVVNGVLGEVGIEGIGTINIANTAFGSYMTTLNNIKGNFNIVQGSTVGGEATKNVTMHATAPSGNLAANLIVGGSTVQAGDSTAAKNGTASGNIEMTGMATVIVNTTLGDVADALLGDDTMVEKLTNVLDGSGAATIIDAANDIKLGSKANLLHGGNFVADGSTALRLTAGNTVEITGAVNAVSGNVIINAKDINLTPTQKTYITETELANLGLPSNVVSLLGKFGMANKVKTPTEILELLQASGMADKLATTGINANVVTGGATLEAENTIKMGADINAVLDTQLTNVLNNSLMTGGSHETTLSAKNIELDGRLNVVNGGKVLINATDTVKLTGTFNVVSGGAEVTGKNIYMNGQDNLGLNWDTLLTGKVGTLADGSTITDKLSKGINGNLVAGGATLKAGSEDAAGIITTSGMATVMTNATVGDVMEALGQIADGASELETLSGLLQNSGTATLVQATDIKLDSRLNLLHGGNFTEDGANALVLDAENAVNMNGTFNVVSGNVTVDAKDINLTGQKNLSLDLTSLITSTLGDDAATLATNSGILDKIKDKGVNANVVTGGATLDADNITMDGMMNAVLDTQLSDVVDTVRTGKTDSLMTGGFHETTLTATNNIDLLGRLNVVNGGQVKLAAGNAVNMNGTFNVVSGGAEVTGKNINMKGQDNLGLNWDTLLTGKVGTLADGSTITDKLSKGINGNLVAGGATLKAIASADEEESGIISTSGMATVMTNATVGDVMGALSEIAGGASELQTLSGLLQNSGVATRVEAKDINLDSRLNLLHGGNFTKDGANALVLDAENAVNMNGTFNVVSGNVIVDAETIELKGQKNISLDWGALVPDKYAAYGEIADSMGIFDKLEKGVNGNVVAGGATLTADYIKMDGMATAIVDTTASNVVDALRTMNASPLVKGGEHTTSLEATNIDLVSRLNVVNGGKVLIDAKETVKMEGTFNVVSGNANVKGKDVSMDADEKVGIDISSALNGHYAEVAEELGMTDMVKNGLSSNVIAGGAKVSADNDVTMKGYATAIVDTSLGNVINAAKQNDLGQLMKGGDDATLVKAGNDIKLISDLNVVNGGNTSTAGGVKLEAGRDVNIGGDISVINRATVKAGHDVNITSGKAVLKNASIAADGIVSFTNTNAEMTDASISGAEVQVTNATLSNTADSTVTISDLVTVSENASIENYGSLTLKDAVIANSTLYSDSANTTVTDKLTLQSATLVYTAESLTSYETAITLGNGGVLQTMGTNADATAVDAIAGVNFVISVDNLKADAFTSEGAAFELALFESVNDADFKLIDTYLAAGEVSFTVYGTGMPATVSNIEVIQKKGHIVVTGNVSVPEPTTATLSLLALAALAGRRRRK